MIYRAHLRVHLCTTWRFHLPRCRGPTQARWNGGRLLHTQILSWVHHRIHQAILMMFLHYLVQESTAP